MQTLPSADLVWLVPGLPLAGFLFHAFLGKRVGKRVVAWVATTVVLLSFAISVKLLLDLMDMPEATRRATVSLLPFGAGHMVPWISIGSFTVNYAALVDPLSVLMCLIVTGVGGLIHLYATGYMAGDKDQPRFFTYFNLFIFFMLTLVLADNLLLMFVGWEGVGLCSYLLIAFWFEDEENAKAGNKAFIVNRIGDVGFALGVMSVFAVFGTLTFRTAQGAGFLDLASRGLTQHGALTVATATLIGLLLFAGACGKSAQFPLYVWLPDAMAGPTPVSALIHAATMVTAGVVMIARVSPLIVRSPDTMIVISVIGVFTAFLAATIALTQNDIKKVLAYSTVSQLGYMFLGCGVGAFAGGMFHVTTHAFFKGLLFLGAGSIIHSMGGEQDMRHMGGLAKKLPITHWTMVAAWLAISGVFPFAGFWSKDQVLEAALHFGANPQLGLALYIAGMVTALLTAFYMTRLMAKTFWTAQRWNEAELGAHGHGGHGGDGHEHHVHESPPSMAVPLIILGVLSAIGGFMNLPGHETFTGFLSASTAKIAEHAAAGGPSVLVLGIIGTAVALAGLLWCWGGYRQHMATGDLLTAEQKAANPVYRGSLNLWYIDQTFRAIFVRGGGEFANAVWQWIDCTLIDGTVNGMASLTAVLSEGFRRVQTGYVRAYAMTMLVGVVLVVVSLLAGWGR